MATKIIDIITNEKISYSFEITPDIMVEELENLDSEPTFYSITWHAHVHKCKDLEIAPLKLAKYLWSKNKIVLLHITCCHMKKVYLNDLLKLLEDIGICNLFIILGEKYDSNNSDFGSSQEMVAYIRQRTGNYFCIGVAGIPYRKGNILQLKEKVNCGVDFILTQAFVESNTLKKFMTECEDAGINVPVIPGVFPFETKKELISFANLCKLQDTEDVLKKLGNESGIKIVTKLANEIIHELKSKHLHFFTMNKIKRTANLIQELSSCLILY